MTLNVIFFIEFKINVTDVHQEKKLCSCQKRHSHKALLRPLS